MTNDQGGTMALSESGLAAQGISPGPMVIQGPGGRRVTVRPKKGPAKSSKRSFYVRPKGRGGRRK